MKKIIISFALFFLSGNAVASAPDTLWTRTYGGSNYDRGWSVQQTSDSGFVIVGYTESFGAGSGDVYLIKTNSSGNALWTKTFGGIYKDEGYWVQETSDGGFIITGQKGQSSIYLIKTDSVGDTLWTKTYSDGKGYSVQQTLDGGFIIGGYATSGANVYLLKTDSLGNNLWTRTFGGTGSDLGWSVQQTLDSGFVVVGYTNSFGAGFDDIYMIKTNFSGDTLWTKTFGGTYWDEGWSVQQTSDSGFIIVGRTYSFGLANGDVYLIKTNSSGDTLWTRAIGRNSYDWGASVQQTSDSGFIIAGFMLGNGAGSADVYLIKTNYSGDTLWTKLFGGVNWDDARSVQQTSDGGFIVAGCTNSFGAGNSDIYLIKLSKETGIEEEQLSGNRQEATVKIIKDKIYLDVPKTMETDVKIYDICGREKEIIYTGTLNKGNYTFVSHIKTNGVYFVNLSAGDYRETQKLILMK